MSRPRAQRTWEPVRAWSQGITRAVPALESTGMYSEEDVRNALDYMGLEPGHR